MRVAVKFFAIIRDRAGIAETTLEVPHDATVATAATALAGKFPGIEPFLARSAFAVNQSYVERTTPLRDGDELAVIPPVSGG
jgi:molybdopterin synthase catalytic subunit